MNRRGSLALVALCLLASVAVALLFGVAANGAGETGSGELVAQPAAGAPAETFLGAAPQEAPGEVWATAPSGGTLSRYTDGGGWSTVPAPVDDEGQPIPELEWRQGPDVGRTTPHGGIVAAALGGGEEPVLVLREPGGSLGAAPEPPPEVLGPEERLFESEGTAPKVAAMEAAGGATRALVVPVLAGGTAPPEAVLSLAGGQWSREPICVGFEAPPSCATPPPGFTVRSIEAAAGDAWLLAEGAAAGEGIELFRRSGGPNPAWRQQPLGGAGSPGALFAQAAPAGTESVAARDAGQALTVSGAGVWVDAQIEVGGSAYPATFYYDVGAGEVTASWCDLAAPAGLCTHELAAELPAGDGRSFAWPGGSGEPFGTRAVTGVGQGAMLSLAGSAFERVSLSGGSAGATLGAALAAPDSGWLGASTPLHLTRNPEPSQLTRWPVPFRRPLTAIAPEPGAPVAADGSEALAVGVDGEAARFVPGLGWEPEFLFTAAGRRATPTLRAVAWPQRNRAYAVGDGATIWIRNGETELWEPDPALPPNLVRGNFTGIAFDPANPNRGYAIGKQGLLLTYARSWSPEALPPQIPAGANLTSIAFSGQQALVSWKYPVLTSAGTVVYSGGVIANDGDGWRVEEAADGALDGGIPQRVAGLPDGGAAIATAEGPRGNGVIERQGAASPWERAAGGPVGYPAALAAIREGGQVRALVSVARQQTSRDLGTDQEQVLNPPPVGQPPLLTDPYPLPGVALLLRQTATGWRDEQHDAYPLPTAGGQLSYDLPARSDPILALLVSPDGSHGWAVGGETGSLVQFSGEAVQTAGVMRYGSSAAPPSNASEVAIPPTSGSANFAVGGGAQCAGPCADLTGTGIGPDRWLRAAIGKAAGVSGLRAFLYTGAGLASGLGSTSSEGAFSREEQAYSRRLGAGATALPVFAAATQSDLDRSSSLSTFDSAFAGFPKPFGSAAPGAGIAPVSESGPGKAYYSFLSSGAGGAVRVIVLDYSSPSLGPPQRCWLAAELAQAGAAGTPAIVVGQRDLAGQVGGEGRATDAGAVVPLLARGAWPAECGSPAGPSRASAYFFDFPEQNRQYSLVSGGSSIPAFGTGTLGYVNPPKRRETDFAGASGFLIASVNVAARNAATNVAPVTVRLVPNVGSLAIDATDGTVIRRSRQALFEALARRPLGGSKCTGAAAPEGCETMSPDPYVPIPDDCQGSKCSTTVHPEYTFTSSKPDIADFVAHDPASPNPRNVLLVGEKPVHDSSSGLLCAFNSGSTVVTVTAGGLSYATKVTVLPGSVQRPCGTTPLLSRTTTAGSPSPAAPVAPAPTPAPAPVPPLLPPPPPPAPAVAPPAASPPPPPAPAPAPAFFLPPLPPPVPPIPIVPPPPTPTFQPTPPSGTAPVQATQREEEEEEAYDTVSQMSALRHDPRPSAAILAGVRGGGSRGVPLLIPALVLLAAIGGAVAVGSRGRSSDPRRRIAYQHANSRRYR